LFEWVRLRSFPFPWPPFSLTLSFASFLILFAKAPFSPSCAISWRKPGPSSLVLLGVSRVPPPSVDRFAQQQQGRTVFFPPVPSPRWRYLKSDPPPRSFFEDFCQSWPPLAYQLPPVFFFFSFLPGDQVRRIGPHSWVDSHCPHFFLFSPIFSLASAPNYPVDSERSAFP